MKDGEERKLIQAGNPVGAVTDSYAALYATASSIYFLRSDRFACHRLCPPCRYPTPIRVRHHGNWNSKFNFSHCPSASQPAFNLSYPGSYFPTSSSSQCPIPQLASNTFPKKVNSVSMGNLGTYAWGRNLPPCSIVLYGICN